MLTRSNFLVIYKLGLHVCNEVHIWNLHVHFLTYLSNTCLHLPRDFHTCPGVAPVTGVAPDLGLAPDQSNTFLPGCWLALGGL